MEQKNSIKILNVALWLFVYALHFVWWKMFGFESAVIVMLSSMAYQQWKNEIYP